MAAACAGLGARARVWRWGGRTAVAMDVPQEEQLPCGPCPSWRRVDVALRGDLLQVTSAVTACLTQLFVYSYMPSSILERVWANRPLDFPPTFRAPSLRSQQKPMAASSVRARRRGA